MYKKSNTYIRNCLFMLSALVLGLNTTLGESNTVEVQLAYSHSGNSAKQPIVKTSRIEDSTVPAEGYASMDEAVIAASDRFNADSIRFNREHVGGILKCADKGYFYTHGVGGEGIAPVQFSIPQTQKCKLSAVWHTHGGNFEDRAFFSPSDTGTAEATDKPIYMADYTGTLRVFFPGDKKMSRNSRKRRGAMLGLPRGTAQGSIVRDGAGMDIRIARI